MKSVLFVGNLVDVKAPDRLLRAWPKVANQHAEARLQIIGSGPMHKRLVKLAGKLDISRAVDFPGGILHDRIAGYMRNAHCLVLPSRSEGMPNVVLESLACGTPVVATAVGEVPYLIEDGINGYVIFRKDAGNADGSVRNQHNEERVIKELSEKISKALEREWDRETVAETVKDFTWEKAARTVIEAIEAKNRTMRNVESGTLDAKY